MNRVTFGASCNYTPDGAQCQNPAIAMNNAFVVSAYTESNSTIFTRVAPLNGEPSLTFLSDESYGIGMSPGIAINNANTVLMVYLKPGNLLTYSVGVAVQNQSDISWQKNMLPVLDSSNNNNNILASSCAVAVNNNNEVMVVFQKYLNSNHSCYDLYYLHGRLDNSNYIVNWDTPQYYTTGILPRVAINNNGYFIEVHQSENHNSIYYTLGKKNPHSDTFSIVKHDEITGESNFDPSTHPSVALNSFGDVLEVHALAGLKAQTLWYNQFKINTSNDHLETICSQRYSIEYLTDGMGGKNPVVALNDNQVAFQMYETNSSHLFGCLSKITERANWMSAYQNKTLKQLSIPGSHDAAMSTASHCSIGDDSNTITQIQNISKQLQVGIRYFDIRPVFSFVGSLSNASVNTGHYSGADGFAVGCRGESMDDILDGVHDFLRDNTSEVVILKFSHFLANGGEGMDYFFDQLNVSSKQTLIDKLTQKIHDKLSSKVFQKPSTSRIVDIHLSQMAGKAVVVYDIQDLATVNLGTNIYTYLDFNADTPNPNSADLVVFDKYTNTDLMSKLISQTEPVTDDDKKHPGQEYLLKTAKYHGGDMFLLSWTLTLQTSDLVNALSYSILQLSQEAGGSLARQLVNMKKNYQIDSTCFPSILYVDACDGFVTDVCQWINSLGLRDHIYDTH